MTTSMSVRDLTQSGSTLFDYDYIDIEDKKANEYKGVFIPKQFAAEVKAFLNHRLLQVKRIPDLQLVASVDALALRHEMVLYGLKGMPVTWSATAAKTQNA